ncbi:hypothetical protein GCM10007298_07100 [Williamsia phyllosphaerae]|uniref:Uncharacterized protein n=1 Tax=Williamsia phyllosphaerae TaxID=885042 RepID=A0ABQ1UB18_9NOCA|nr:hypothetical protein GCM10007298_07100 [Williamsia phyllosphaerae]
MGTQQLVTDDDGVEDSGEIGFGEIVGGDQCDALVETLHRITHLVEPGGDRGGPDRTDGLDVGARGERCGVADHRRECANGAVGEHVPRSQGVTVGAQPGHDADGDDAVAAEGEEVGVDVTPVRIEVEHIGEHRAQRDLARRGRRGRLTHGVHNSLFRRTARECDPVGLAVGGHRHLIEHGDLRRHHVLGQRLRRPLQQFVARDTGRRRDVGDQRRARLLAHGDDRGVYRRVIGQGRLDLLEFDAAAADLDLVVGAAQELQRPLGRPPGQVTGAVHPGPVGVERVGHEPGAGQRGCVDVSTTEQEPGRVQLAADARRDRREVLVEYVELSVRVGRPDRGGDAFGDVTVDHMGDTDGGLGGTVTVIERGGQLITETAEQIRGENLAAAPHVAQSGESRRTRASFGHRERIQLQQRVQHRRDEVDVGDALGFDELEQVFRVFLAVRLGDHDPSPGHQREQDLVDGDVEGQRRLEQRGVIGSEVQDLVALPAQAFADRLVADHGALRRAGRPGREDHVRQPARLDLDVGKFGGLVGEGPVRQRHLDGRDRPPVA